MRSDYLTSLRLMRSAYLTSLHITIASLSSHHITPSTHFTHSQCIAFFISTLLCAFKRFTFHQHTHTRTPQHKVSSNGSHFTNTLTLAPLNTRYLQTVHISPTHSHSHPSTQGTFKRFTFHQHTYTRTPQHKVPSNGSHFTNTLTLAPLNTRYLQTVHISPTHSHSHPSTQGTSWGLSLKRSSRWLLFTRLKSLRGISHTHATQD
jgi:hypothetical protein